MNNPRALNEPNSLSRRDDPGSLIDAYPATRYQRPADVLSLVDVVLRRKLLIICVFLLVFALGAAYTFTRRSVYESTVQLVVAGNRNLNEGTDDPSLVGDVQALTKSRSVATQLEIIRNPAVLGSAYRALLPHERIEGFGSDVLPDWVCAASAEKDSDAINLTVRSYTPELARRFADIVAQTYLKKDMEVSGEATRQARGRIDDELSQARTSLADAQGRLAERKRQYGIIGDMDQFKQESDSLAQLQMESEKADSEWSAARNHAERLGQTLASQGQEVTESRTTQENPLFAKESERLSELNARRAELLQEYLPESEEVKKIDGQITDVRERLARLKTTVTASKVESRNPIAAGYAQSVATSAAAGARARALSRALADRRRQMAVLPEQEKALSMLQDEVETLRRNCDVLSRKRYTLLINEKSMQPNAMVVAAATTPLTPSYPSRAKNAVMFLVLGIIASSVAALVAERLDTRVNDIVGVASVTGSAQLSAIPSIRGNGHASLVIDGDRHPAAFTESFRILRNNILLSTYGLGGIRRIAVTSPGAGDGKSTASVNLAIALAMDGKTVLIADCDLHREMLPSWAHSDGSIGLTTIASGMIPARDAVAPTAFANVWYLPSGPLPNNPAEFLNTPQCRESLHELANSYDVMVIDCPPCVGLSDMQIIATMVDGVLLVVSANHTQMPDLAAAASSLDQVGARIIGYVMNRFESRGRPYGYRYS